jgi:hypothetical protein
VVFILQALGLGVEVFILQASGLGDVVVVTSFGKGVLLVGKLDTLHCWDVLSNHRLLY